MAFGVTALVLCSDGAGWWGLVAGMYAAISVQAVAAWAFVRWRPRLKLASVAMWKELARYGRHVLGSEILRDSNLKSMCSLSVAWWVYRHWGNTVTDCGSPTNRSKAG